VWLCPDVDGMYKTQKTQAINLGLSVVIVGGPGAIRTPDPQIRRLIYDKKSVTLLEAFVDFKATYKIDGSFYNHGYTLL